ncbi:MAG: NUDIX hydrolase [Defluviimonas sp.]|uniref:NUDIX hydrolase n=1 Tax=Albidovulum sp. TaxID=1872424 RepID=UPI001DDFE4A7|nr:NUDIX hydrolase [Paracoccaceae bacterium]MCC0063213.1 NUDIX hydrolase [Defluviimonas sp.]
MATDWLAHARRLHAIAATGVHFAAGPHDRERYEEIAAIAEALLSALARTRPERVRGLSPDFGRGYVTPQVDVRGALVRDGRVLLVREATDGRWALPGGYADVGLSPAENVEKEIAEEAGLAVRAERLFAVKHKARHGYDPDLRDFYKLFFLCSEVAADIPPRAGSEATDAAFFAPDALPELSTGRVIAEDIAAAFAAAAGSRAVHFD